MQPNQQKIIEETVQFYSSLHNNGGLSTPDASTAHGHLNYTILYSWM